MCAFSLVFAPLTQALTLREQVQAACEEGNAETLESLVRQGAKFARSDSEYATALVRCAQGHFDRDELLELSQEHHEFWDDRAINMCILRFMANPYYNGIIDDDFLFFLLDNHILNNPSNEILTSAILSGYNSSVEKIKEMMKESELMIRSLRVPYLPSDPGDRHDHYWWNRRFTITSNPTETIDRFLACGCTPTELFDSFFLFTKFSILKSAISYKDCVRQYSDQEEHDRCCNKDYCIKGRNEINNMQRAFEYLIEKGADVTTPRRPYDNKNVLESESEDVNPFMIYILIRSGKFQNDNIIEILSTAITNYYGDKYNWNYRYTKELLKMLQTGVPLPDSYLEFLKSSSVGEGCCTIL